MILGIGHIKISAPTAENVPVAHSEMPNPSPSIAVIIPCLDEERTIPFVIRNFAQIIPEATIYVYDNNSTDHTVEVAQAEGAIVRSEPMRGKGYVVRRMFADVDADIFVLVDGDHTYDAAVAPAMIKRLLDEDLDVVTGRRVDCGEPGAYRFGHRFGNAALTLLLDKLFGSRLADVLSGYRVLSRRFVKSFPALSRGFEIEIEMTVHALELALPIAEVDSPYRARPEHSASKLRTVRDGIRLLITMVRLFQQERPFIFYGGLAAVLALLSLVLGYPVVKEFFESGLVPRLPTAVLAAAIMIVASTSFAIGLILNSICTTRREMRRIAYLATARPRAMPTDIASGQNG